MAADMKDPARLPRSVLVVEDDPVLAIGIETALLDAGIATVELTSTTDDALAALRRATGTMDAVGPWAPLPEFLGALAAPGRAVELVDVGHGALASGTRGADAWLPRLTQIGPRPISRSAASRQVDMCGVIRAQASSRSRPHGLQRPDSSRGAGQSR